MVGIDRVRWGHRLLVLLMLHAPLARGDETPRSPALQLPGMYVADAEGCSFALHVEKRGDFLIVRGLGRMEVSANDATPLNVTFRGIGPSSGLRPVRGMFTVDPGGHAAHQPPALPWVAIYDPETDGWETMVSPKRTVSAPRVGTFGERGKDRGGKGEPVRFSDLLDDLGLDDAARAVQIADLASSAATAIQTHTPPAVRGQVAIVSDTLSTGYANFMSDIAGFGNRVAVGITGPAAPPPATDPVAALAGKPLDEVLGALWAAGTSNDQVSSVLATAPDASRAWQVATITTLPDGRIEIIHYGSAPDDASGRPVNPGQSRPGQSPQAAGSDGRPGHLGGPSGTGTTSLAAGSGQPTGAASSSSQSSGSASSSTRPSGRGSLGDASGGGSDRPSSTTRLIDAWFDFLRGPNSPLDDLRDSRPQAPPLVRQPYIPLPPSGPPVVMPPPPPPPASVDPRPAASAMLPGMNERLNTPQPDPAPPTRPVNPGRSPEDSTVVVNDDSRTAPPNGQPSLRSSEIDAARATLNEAAGPTARAKSPDGEHANPGPHDDGHVPSSEPADGDAAKPHPLEGTWRQIELSEEQKLLGYQSTQEVVVQGKTMRVVSTHSYANGGPFTHHGKGPLTVVKAATYSWTTGHGEAILTISADGSRLTMNSSGVSATYQRVK